MFRNCLDKHKIITVRSKITFIKMEMKRTERLVTMMSMLDKKDMIENKTTAMIRLL